MDYKFSAIFCAMFLFGATLGNLWYQHHRNENYICKADTPVNKSDLH